MLQLGEVSFGRAFICALGALATAAMPAHADDPNQQISGIEIPGSTSYPDGGMWITGFATGRYDTPLSGFLDSDGSHLLLGTLAGDSLSGYSGDAATILKVRLGGELDPMELVSRLELERGEPSLTAAIFDPATSTALFATAKSPSQIIKVAAGNGDAPPQRIGSIDLEPGESITHTGSWDEQAGVAYFATSFIPPRIVRVDLGGPSDPPARIDSINLEDSERPIVSSVIDAQRGFALFGTQTSPGKIVKVSLGDSETAPARIGALQLDAGRNAVLDGVVDVQHGIAYFAVAGTGADNPARLVSVGLGDDLEVPTLIGEEEVNGPFSSVTGLSADWEHNVLYGLTGVGTLQRFNIDRANGLITHLDTQSIPDLAFGVRTYLDAESGYLFAESGVSSVSGSGIPSGWSGITTVLAKLDLGDRTGPPSHLSSLGFEENERPFSSLTLGSQTNTLLAGSGLTVLNARVTKFETGGPAEPPSRIAGQSIHSPALLTTGERDPAAGSSLFGFSSSTTSRGEAYRVARVNPGAPGEAPQLIEKLEDVADLGDFESSFHDPNSGFIVMGGGYPGQVFAYSLPPGDVPPVEEEQLTLPIAGIVSAAGVDPQTGISFYATRNLATFAGVASLSPFGEAQPPTPIDTFQNLGHVSSGFPRSIVVDHEARRIVVAIFDSSGGTIGRFVVLDYDESGLFSTPPTVFAMPQVNPYTGAFDPIRKRAYFANGFGADRGGFAALDLSSSTVSPLGRLVPNLPELPKAHSLVLDAQNGYLFAGTQGAPGRVYKVATSFRDRLSATRLELADTATVQTMSFYSHRAEGNLQLGIYDDSSPRELMWTSGSIVNTAGEDFLIIPIAEGTPSELTLPEGTYWLAWQSDVIGDVASYAGEQSGGGFYFPHAYGPMPTSLDDEGIVGTSQQWTQFLTFEPVVSPPSPGDANADGMINVADVTELGNFLAGRIELLVGDGDVNDDGVVDQSDLDALVELIVQ